MLTNSNYEILNDEKKHYSVGARSLRPIGRETQPLQVHVKYGNSTYNILPDEKPPFRRGEVASPAQSVGSVKRDKEK